MNYRNVVTASAVVSIVYGLIVVLLPQQAVQRDTVGAYVLAVGKDDNVVRHDVTTSTMSGGDWIVNSGIQAGDQIIVSGVQNAKEGAPVKPSPWHSTTSTAQGTATHPAPVQVPAQSK